MDSKPHNFGMTLEVPPTFISNRADVRDGVSCFRNAICALMSQGEGNLTLTLLGPLPRIYVVIVAINTSGPSYFRTIVRKNSGTVAAISVSLSSHT